MTVIAMGRELGSRGKRIADGVAAALGLPVIHYEVIDHLSDRSRVRRSHVVRLLDAQDDPHSDLTPDHTLPAILSAYEILELASLPEGCLLRGWGACALMREVPSVLRVRVTAPKAERLAVLKSKFSTAEEGRLKAEIDLFDEAHRAIMRRHFGVEFDDDSLYHMSLDTSVTPVEECIERIIAASREERFSATDQSARRLASLMTEAHVKALLKLHPPTRQIAIEVAADQKVVHLRGTVASEELKARCELVAWRVPGIEGVHNALAVAA